MAFPQHHLKVQPRDGSGFIVELDDADIYLPQETKDLLVKFGWTPPAEESAGELSQA